MIREYDAERWHQWTDMFYDFYAREYLKFRQIVNRHGLTGTETAIIWHGLLSIPEFREKLYTVSVECIMQKAGVQNYQEKS